MSVVMQSVVSLILLFIGGGIYLLFRPKSLLMFKWVDNLGLTSTVDRLRDCVSHISLGQISTYSLPDGLWVASYVVLVHAIVPKQHKENLLFWSFILPLIAIFFEILQGIGIIPGVFDIFDLACYLIPLIIYTLYLRYEKVI
ncbi:MAG: hypothetical protein H6Q13_2873 [Bacteroidetes bacterium]|nr:hypothetical protein [Bacteroidota bacterium]